LQPPRETAQALHEWAGAVQRTSGGRVTRPEPIHLTLAFLGEVEEGRVATLKALEPRAAKHRLPIEQARYWKHNRIVWVGPLQTPAAAQGLVSSLGSILKQNGFRTEARDFTAHITLIRKARDPGRLPPVPEVSWPVEEAVLLRSRLSREGSSYEIVQRYPLS